MLLCRRARGGGARRTAGQRASRPSLGALVTEEFA